MALNYLVLNAPASLEVSENYKKINWPKGEYYSEDVFVVYGETSPLAARLKYFNIPPDNRVIVIKKGEDMIEKVKKGDIIEKEDYNIFSGEKVPTSLDKDMKKDILKSMKTLSYVAYQMLGVGYLEEKSTGKIEDWIPSFQEPILKLFRDYFEFEVSNEDYLMEEEFMINPQFRKMILVTLLKVLANFVINNNLAKKTDIQDWMSTSEWQKLKKVVKLFQ